MLTVIIVVNGRSNAVYIFLLRMLIYQNLMLLLIRVNLKYFILCTTIETEKIIHVHPFVIDLS